MAQKKPSALLISFGLALVLATSCATAHKRAAKFMAEGLFAEAVKQYEEILGKDPKDEDAIVGLKLARTSLLDRRLIEARMARLGGNPAQSLDLLLDVSQKQVKWQLPVVGKVAFTQQEESEFAVQYAATKIHGDLQEKKPLRAKYFLNRYQPVLAPSSKPKFAQWETEVARSGKQSCKSFSGSQVPAHPYFTRFVTAYCQFWGETNRAPSARGKDTGEAPSFRTLEVATSQIVGLPADQASFLLQASQQAFTGTAWYDPGSREILPVTVTGRFHESRNKSEVRLTHVYKVSEPFTDRVKVKKQRQIPYQETSRVPDANAPGGFRTTEVTRYRNEEYEEEEAKTVYREVERTYPYRAWKHEQRLELSLAAQVRILDRALEASLGETSNTDGIEHDENQSSIGLKPSRPQLASPSDWLHAQSTRFASNLQASAGALWMALYCTPPANAEGSVAEVGNHVLRCLRQPMDRAPAFADTWYESQVGLNVADATSLVRVR